MPDDLSHGIGKPIVKGGQGKPAPSSLAGWLIIAGALLTLGLIVWGLL
jgi:hypothetical protein